MVTCIVTLDNIVSFDTIVLWEYQQLLASSFQLIYISKPDYRYNERVWLYNTCLVLSMVTTAYICFVITSHTSVHTCMHTHTYTQSHTYTHTYSYTHNTHTDTHTQTCIYIYIYIYIYIHIVVMYTCLCVIHYLSFDFTWFAKSI